MALATLLKKARRRVLWQLVGDKVALALTIAMGGVVALLVAGADLLAWYWPAVLALAGLGAGLYQLRGGIPSAYRVAQRVDRRLQLADVLSTAFHFLQHPDPQRAAVCDHQRRSAEETAATVDVRQALPYTRSRYLAPAAALAMVALALFWARYTVSGSLDLSRSLIALAAESFFPEPSEIASSQVKKGNLEPQPFDPGSPNRASDSDEPLPESLMEDPQESGEGPKTSGKDPAGAEAKQDQGNKDGESGDRPPPEQEGSESPADNSKDGKEGNSKNDSGMLDKLRDALANLLNRNRPEQRQGQNSQKSQSQKSQDADKQDQNPGDANSTEAGQKQDQNARQQSDSKGGESSDKMPQEAASSQGDKVGDKTIRNAEALEAMGKISELLGKRSATVQGEMMVEVGQTKQQLKTQWSSREAGHSGAGGEIHRDEVPLMYQPYVEQYFEEIRKGPEGGARAKAGAAKRAKGAAEQRAK
jgi:hypothetical protein